MDAQTIKRWVVFFGYWLVIFTVCMLIALSVGCTYTHTSVAEPDLIERVTNGHKVCYYKTVLDAATPSAAMIARCMKHKR